MMIYFSFLLYVILYLICVRKSKGPTYAKAIISLMFVLIFAYFVFSTNSIILNYGEVNWGFRSSLLFFIVSLFLFLKNFLIKKEYESKQRIEREKDETPESSQVKLKHRPIIFLVLPIIFMILAAIGGTHRELHMSMHETFNLHTVRELAENIDEFHEKNYEYPDSLTTLQNEDDFYLYDRMPLDYYSSDSGYILIYEDTSAIIDMIIYDSHKGGFREDYNEQVDRIVQSRTNIQQFVLIILYLFFYCFQIILRRFEVKYYSGERKNCMMHGIAKLFYSIVIVVLMFIFFAGVFT